MPHPIVIIDGNDDILQSLQVVLVEEGYTTILFQSAQVALDYLHDQPPTLVLFDDEWPYLQESEILAALTATPPIGRQHVYILMSTRKKLPPALQSLIQTLHIPLVTKPFDVDTLSAIIAQMAEQLAVM